MFLLYLSIAENVYMVRINLLFDVYKNAVVINNSVQYDLIRLKSGIQFKIKNGLLKKYSALVDTGAHISIFPRSIWQKLEYELVGESHLHGIVRSENCSIPVSVGKIKYSLTDRYGNETEEKSALAFLAHTDKVPIILGFKEVIEKLRIYFNFQNNMAYAEEV